MGKARLSNTMRILISCIHYPVSAPKFLAKALRQLGHDVYTVGPNMGGRLPWSSENFDKYEWRSNFAPYAPDNTYCFSEIGTRFTPDLIVQCDANFFMTGLTPCPNVVWAVDNHVAAYDKANFDVFFGAHSWGYGSDKENFHWLPCAYDPQEHYQIPDAVKHFDAAMIGVMYPQRVELLNALAPHGSILAGTGLLGKEYNEAYSHARIALISSACGDVPMRVFENATQGCLILCDRMKDLDKLGLTEGQDYIGYSTVEEAVGEFRLHGFRNEENELIASNGKVTLAAHTYEARAQTILDTCREKGLI